jgi:hypothetical protein
MVSSEGIEFIFEVSKSLPDQVIGEKRRLSYLTNTLLGISTFRSPSFGGKIKVRIGLV